jgi:photosystem II stability/assembly factor-like uncharacterized protein
MSDPRCQRPTLRPLILAFALIFLFHLMARAQWVQTLTAESPRTPKIFALTLAGPHLFAGFESGVFRSSDQGDTWTQVNNGLGDFPTVFSLAARGSTVYAGTVSGGVYRSIDYGDSWSRAGLNGEYITVLAATDGALMAGTCCRGLYRSTDDGATWSHPLAESLYVKDIAVSGGFMLAGSSRGLFRSSDQGASWEHIPFAAGLSDSAVGPFAVLGTTLFAAARQGLYRSEDNGGTWTRSALEEPDADVLLASGGDLFVSSYRRLFRSSDRGDTWIRIDSGLAPSLGNPPSIFCLAVDRGNLFAGVSQAGVWRRPLVEVATAIVPFRSPGSKAGAGYSGYSGYGGYGGRPGFIPGMPGVLQTDLRAGFHIDGRHVALPPRLRSRDRSPVSQ